MIKLSKRLLTIASFVRSDAKIVDVGCDHALLDIYLVYHNPNLKAIAVEVRQGALNQANQNIVKYNMEKKIDLRLGDGLDTVAKDEMDTIIISGLGCATIIEILTKNKNKLVSVSDLIVQSNTDNYNLRKTICALGFFIAHEKLVKESGKIYLIVHFQRGKKKYSRADYIYGPILRVEKNALYKEFLNEEIKKKEILYSLIPQKYFLKRQRVKINILKLKNRIK